jgi:hypothetical protein
LQDLREMRARGDLADDEYQRLKARVLGLVTPTADAGDDARPGSSKMGSSQGE